MPFPRDPNAPGSPERSAYLTANHAAWLTGSASSAATRRPASMPSARSTDGEPGPLSISAAIAAISTMLYS